MKKQATTVIITALVLLIAVPVLLGGKAQFSINNISGSLIAQSKKDSNNSGKKCYLVGYQQGWKLPEYEIISDSLKVDSIFTCHLSKERHPWKAINRNKYILEQTENSRFYAEIGTYTVTNSGRKKFTGMSGRKYLKKRFK